MTKLSHWLLLMLPLFAHGAELRPFATDGCSLFPDGTLTNSVKWQHCCISHDLAYWQGGTQTQRDAADAALAQCVRDLDEPVIATLMHIGVQLGGGPLYPTWYRWGYGWPYARSYGALTNGEQQQVQKRLAELVPDDSLPKDPSDEERP